MQGRLLGAILSAVLVCASTQMPAAALQDQTHSGYRTLNDRLKPGEYATAAEWQRRAAYLRDHILVSAGPMPFPEKTPLRAQIFGGPRRRDYWVWKVYVERR